MDTSCSSSVLSNSTAYTTLSTDASCDAASLSTSTTDTRTSSPPYNDTASSMPPTGATGVSGDTYIRKLPYRVMSKVYGMLDPDALWKRLCLHITHKDTGQPRYTVYDIKNFELSLSRGATGGSPTEDVLRDWGTQNTTVRQLLEALTRAQLYHAANYIAHDLLQEPPVYEATHVTPTLSPYTTANVSIKLGKESVAPVGSGEELGEFSLHVANQASAAGLMAANPHSDQPRNNIITVISPASGVREFAYAMLSRATAGFSTESCIGHGGFGTVYRSGVGSTSETDATQLAIKVLETHRRDIEKQFKTEVDLLSSYQHTNIVPLLGYSIDGPRLCLVYAFMSGGSLLDRLAPHKCPTVLTWGQRLDIALDTALGLEYLHGHERKLIHRDIKSANILLDDHDRARIGDFGIAKLRPQTYGESEGSEDKLTTSFQTATIIGTSAYMAPEAFRGTVTVKLDVFAYGVILLELLTGQPPMDDTREETDLISYVEELAAESGGSAVDIVDPRCRHGDGVGESAEQLLAVARRCYATSKRDRPDMTLVVEELGTIKKGELLEQN